MAYQFTSTKQLQTAFRKEFKGKLDFKLITAFSGKGKMYNADVRVNFIDWLSDLHNNGLISDRLANQAYLEPSK
jgi:hypothetical protein